MPLAKVIATSESTAAEDRHSWYDKVVFEKYSGTVKLDG